MNDKNTHTKGQHLGSVHADPIIQNEIRLMNIKGWDTCLILEYEAMIAQGVKPARYLETGSMISIEC